MKPSCQWSGWTFQKISSGRRGSSVAKMMIAKGVTSIGITVDELAARAVSAAEKPQTPECPTTHSGCAPRRTRTCAARGVGRYAGASGVCDGFARGRQ